MKVLLGILLAVGFVVMLVICCQPRGNNHDNSASVSLRTRIVPVR